MASPENISLNDLFNLYMGLDKVVFVKNVSDDTSRDTLECYLAAILKRDVIKVHYPADVNCCCIAVVHRPIRGLRKFGKDLAELPLEGNVLEMCSLGGCAGLLIRNPPIEQSDMVALELFVKSTEFVGDEKDAVKEIKYVPCLSGRCVVVQIPDTAVVSRILNRPKHPQFHNLDLDIDPYFPNLHDLLGQHNEVEDLHVPCLQAELLEIDQTFQAHDDKYPGKDTRRCTDEAESGNKRKISTEKSAKEMTLSSKSRIFLEDSDSSEKDESNKSKEVICVQKASAFKERDIAVVKESMQRSSKVSDEQTEVPSIFNLGPDNTSNSRSEDRFDQKGTSQQFASTTADSCNNNTLKIAEETQSAASSEQFDVPPTGILVSFESASRPSSHRHRFRQKAKEFQHGLSEEEAFEQALAQSMSANNISGAIQEQDRSGREEPSNDDQNAYFGTSEKQVVSRILNRPEHPQFHNHDLDIDPYLPNLHDQLGQQDALVDLHVPCLQSEVFEIDQPFQAHDDKYLGKDARRCADEDESGNKRNISTDKSAKEMTLSSKFRIFLEDSDSSKKEESHKSKEVMCVEKALAFEKGDIAVINECMQRSSKCSNEQTEVPLIFNLGLDNTSNSGSEDRFDQKGISQPFASTTTDSGNKNTEKVDDGTQSAASSERFDTLPTGMLVGFESIGRPSSHSHRFRQKAKEFQHGLSEEEAFEQALAQSMSDHNISGAIQEQDRSGREEPSNDDQTAYFGTTEKQAVLGLDGSERAREQSASPRSRLSLGECNPFNQGEIADDMVVKGLMQTPFNSYGNVFNAETTLPDMTGYFPDDATKSKSFPDFYDQQTPEMVSSHSTDSFDKTTVNKGYQHQAAVSGEMHGFPSAGNGAVPKSAGPPSSQRYKVRQKMQEFQSGKSEVEALNEAMAQSMVDQDKNQPSQNQSSQNRHRNRRDKLTRQRSHSAEGSDRDTKPHYRAASAGQQVQEHAQKWVSSSSADKVASSHDYNQSGKHEKGTGSYEKVFPKRVQLQEFQPGKSDDVALDEAVAKSIADQDQNKLSQNRRRNRRDKFSRQRSRSVERSGRDTKPHYRAESDGKQIQENQQKWLSVSSADKVASSLDYKQSDKQHKGKASYEKTLQKRGNISDKGRAKIRDTLKRLHVKSLEDPKTKNYVLKGDEDSVKEAYTEILQILLDDTTANDASKERRKARRTELRTKPEMITEYMAMKHEPEVPEYWKNFKPGSLIKDVYTAIKQFFMGNSKKAHYKVELEPTDPVYKTIIRLINDNWKETYVGQGNDAKGLKELRYRRIEVTKIERIENLQVYEKYLCYRKSVFVTAYRKNKSSCRSVEKLPASLGPVMTQDLKKCHVISDELFSQINEHFFFHGTTESTVDIICNAGLDFRPGSETAMYGKGIYGAESPTKADQYADSVGNRSKRNRKMFLIRIVLGECYLCTSQDPHRFCKPPCANMKHLRDDCKDISHGSFDSVIGQSKRLFREFVVYHKEQCYPEYLITYNRV